MLLPKRVKHRKQHRGRMTGVATRGNKVTYGEYTKRGGQVWIKIFPDKPITARPADTRMGKGKGNVDYWVAVVKPGRVMFELGGVEESVAREAMRLAANKLPVKCKFVKKEGGEQE